MSQSQKEIVKTKCSSCKLEVLTRKANLQRAARQNKPYICYKCVPQRTSSYWEDPKIKERHSQTMKGSSKYYESLKTRDTSGIKNSMFGKKHSVQTRLKMSAARRGKVKSKTKGNLNKRIRKYLHTELNWYFRIYQRDGFHCTKCGGTKPRLDAHHIIPLQQLIAKALQGKEKLSENQKLAILKKNKLIRDKNLKNGTTLCRKCHKKIHKSWGSHNARQKRQFRKSYEGV